MPRNRIIPYNPKLKNLARELRKNMTFGEVLLWQEIRNRRLGYQFHRQVPIDAFIVDFYCHELQLAIEIDGSSHNHPEMSKIDIRRQQKLEKLGVNFLRFGEAEVRKNTGRVVSDIHNWITDKTK